MFDNKLRVASKAIRVAIVDDHPGVQDGLRLLLDLEPGFEVCGVAGNISDAYKMITRESPDVAVIDLSLGDENGLQLIRRLIAKNSSMRILVWSMFDDLLYAERALSAGAMGYLNKRQSTDMIFQAIRKVMSGVIFLSEQMTNQMIHRSVGKRPTPGQSPLASLSDRELEVFRLIGGGKTTAEISRALHLSVKTVETHRQRIKDKLQLEDATKLVREAVQWVLESS